MSWNILPKNVLQYFLTKLKGLMYTKTEVDSLIPSITPNPSTTTGVLNGLEIDGTGYAVTANTATKLSTARAINLGRDLTGAANFDGSSDITINANFYACSVNGGNTANYPWHRIAKIENIAETYNDKDAILFVKSNFHGGGFGIVKISLRTNGNGAACNVSALWLVRCNISVNDIVIAQWGTTRQSVYADIFLKCGTYPRRTVYQMMGSRQFTLVDSQEKDNTTSSDKKGSVECYTTVAAAATEIHNKAYTQTIDATDAGSVSYASSAGSATKASILDGFGSGGAGNFTWGNQTGTGIWRNNDGGGGEFGFRKNNPSSGQVSMVIDGTVYVNEGRYQVWDKGSLTNLNQLTNGPGYITGINKTMVTNALGYTPPTKDTNDAVKQTNCGTNNWNLRALLSGSQDDTQRTESVYKSQDLQYNPHWKALYIGSNNRTWGMIYAQGNQQLNLSASAEENYRLFLGVRESTWSLAPLYNQYLKLGTGSFKWNQIYSSSATINTSDRRKKKDIHPLDENARIFVMKLNPVSYKMKDGETGRTHYGMIAQDIEDELTELGMTAMDFAGFCKDEVYENVKTTKEGFTEVKTIKKPGEYIYGLRYEEFIAPLIKTVQLQQQEIEELKHRIDILEGK